MQNRIIDSYFDWLFDLACGKRYSAQISFWKLLTRLHQIPFRYSLMMDQNRAEDGIDMRYRFAVTEAYEYDVDTVMEVLSGPCSVLEMMLGLAVRCEETIMDDPAIGDRTSQWFWEMITNLGLGSMSDYRFDRRIVDDIIYKFLDRNYEPDGTGGLFTISNCDRDLREVEIWNQLCWYLNSIT